MADAKPSGVLPITRFFFITHDLISVHACLNGPLIPHSVGLCYQVLPPPEEADGLDDSLPGA